ncbi:MAG: GTPase HflX [Treponema sp.]|nr:GTPase HflX [Treponema sp.]
MKTAGRIKIYETEEKPKRVFLVSLYDTKAGRRPGSLSPVAGSREEAESLAKELAALAGTLGLEIAAQEIIPARERPPKYGLGTGRVQELAERAAELEADCFVFDWDPSPSQQRNWETLTGLPAVDRQELIIRIFADRALTREAELQVRLAELNYALPRLSHRYIDLSRQRGGRYGTRGSGETRLETDRRQVEQRIYRLRQELEEVRRQREIQRKQRERQDIPVCALVGYTNAGKSSLLNALTGAEVPVEDKFFVTLDAVSRRFEPLKGFPVLLVDTVGFIRKLPHTLVDAFHSTLEEAVRADLLIHVLDAVDPDIHRHYETTVSVLEELGAGRIPRIDVLNKIDRPEASSTESGLAALLGRYPGAIPLSALAPVSGQGGLEELRARIGQILAAGIIRFRFPLSRPDLASLLHRQSQVISETWEEDHIAVEARVGGKLSGQLKSYVV